MKPLSILMIHTRKYPCSHAMLETIYTKILPARGHRITWIMWPRESSSIRGWQLVEWNGTKVYLLEGDQQKNSWQKFKGRSINAYKAMQYIIPNQHVDIIQVRNDWVTGSLAVLMQKRWKIPFVYQLSFPEHEMMNYLGGTRKGMAFFIKKIQYFLLKKATLVLPITDWMQSQLVQQGVPLNKMLSFPLGVDTGVKPSDFNRQDIRNELGLGDSPVLIYFGEMGRARQLDFLMRVLDLVSQKMPNVKLLMVGKSSESDGDIEWLKSIVVNLGLQDRVIFTGYVPRSEVPRYIAAADVGISPIVPIPMYQISSPTKLMETMGMAKPVVANDIPEQHFILSESRAGICVRYSERDFSESVLWLLQHPKEACEMGIRGRKYIEEHRSYDMLADKIEDAYYRLLSNSI